MEEAYNELYQQFLQLRSLCLRQAALLHQLTTALQKQQGAAVPNGELNSMMSIPVQCSQEPPVCLREAPQPLTAAAHSPAARRGSLSGNVATFSDLLADDMSKLCMELPSLEQKVAPLLSLESSRWTAASSSASRNLLQADRPSGDGTVHTVTMSAADSPCLVSDVQHECGGLLMSDVALQSHVCEFCQAVFPGDTTTRGEFLRHLYTHVT